jgi:hypothetical protein
MVGTISLVGDTVSARQRNPGQWMVTSRGDASEALFDGTTVARHCQAGRGPLITVDRAQATSARAPNSVDCERDRSEAQR